MRNLHLGVMSALGVLSLGVMSGHRLEYQDKTSIYFKFSVVNESRRSVNRELHLVIANSVTN